MIRCRFGKVTRSSSMSWVTLLLLGCHGGSGVSRLADTEAVDPLPVCSREHAGVLQLSETCSEPADEPVTVLASHEVGSIWQDSIHFSVQSQEHNYTWTDKAKQRWIRQEKKVFGPFTEASQECSQSPAFCFAQGHDAGGTTYVVNGEAFAVGSAQGIRYAYSQNGRRWIAQYPGSINLSGTVVPHAYQEERDADPYRTHLFSLVDEAVFAWREKQTPEDYFPSYMNVNQHRYGPYPRLGELLTDEKKQGWSFAYQADAQGKDMFLMINGRNYGPFPAQAATNIRYEHWATSPFGYGNDVHFFNDGNAWAFIAPRVDPTSGGLSFVLVRDGHGLLPSEETIALHGSSGAALSSYKLSLAGDSLDTLKVLAVDDKAESIYVIQKNRAYGPFKGTSASLHAQGDARDWLLSYSTVENQKSVTYVAVNGGSKVWGPYTGASIQFSNDGKTWALRASRNEYPATTIVVNGRTLYDGIRSARLFLSPADTNWVMVVSEGQSQYSYVETSFGDFVRFKGAYSAPLDITFSQDGKRWGGLSAHPEKSENPEFPYRYQIVVDGVTSTFDSAENRMVIRGIEFSPNGTKWYTTDQVPLGLMEGGRAYCTGRISRYLGIEPVAFNADESLAVHPVCKDQATFLGANASSGDDKLIGLPGGSYKRITGFQAIGSNVISTGDDHVEWSRFEKPIKRYLGVNDSHIKDLDVLKIHETSDGLVVLLAKDGHLKSFRIDSLRDENAGFSSRLSKP